LQSAGSDYLMLRATLSILEWKVLLALLIAETDLAPKLHFACNINRMQNLAGTKVL
jgi:hypothetical protein